MKPQILKELISVNLLLYQINYIKKQAEKRMLSDSDIIRESLRKFLDHYDSLINKGVSIKFPVTERSGTYQNIPLLVPKILLTDVSYIYIAEKRKKNISEATRIGLDLMMKKSISI